MAVGDLNGDGKLDLVTANKQEATGVSVLLGNGDGTLQSPVDFPLTAGSRFGLRVALGDFNGDGKPDVAVATPDNLSTPGADAGINVLLNQGNGTLLAATNIPLDGSERERSCRSLGSLHFLRPISMATVSWTSWSPFKKRRLTVVGPATQSCCLGTATGLLDQQYILQPVCP